MLNAPMGLHAPQSMLCEQMGCTKGSFSTSVSNFKISVEDQIEGIKKETNQLNRQFQAMVKSKQLWLSHKIAFMGGMNPRVVWKRNDWGVSKTVCVSARTHQSIHLFRCKYLTEGLKELLAMFEVKLVGLRIRLSNLLALNKLLSEVL